MTDNKMISCGVPVVLDYDDPLKGMQKQLNTILKKQLAICDLLEGQGLLQGKIIDLLETILMYLGTSGTKPKLQ